jgi:branched-chain amino acid transport system ATP-binding protein
MDERTAGSALLSLDGISLAFGSLQALAGVSFEVELGDTTALVGPNGSGKTTVLNCVNRVYRQHAGHLQFDGRLIDGLRPDHMAALGIGRTFQSPVIFNDMTVDELMMLGRHVRLPHSTWSYAVGAPFMAGHEARARLRCQEILEMAGVPGVGDQVVGGLSYGQSKRVDLARTLAQEPRLLLLDEPASGLSGAERILMSETLERVRAEFRDITLLLVEHDMSFVRRLCSRLIALSAGRKIADGPVADVLASPEVLGSFLGSTSQIESSRERMSS